MNYCKINKADSANGTGIRVSIFVSGCEHKCKGCFSPETWDYDTGQRFTLATGMEIAQYILNNSFISGVTLLGGDPLAPKNRDTVADFCEFYDKFRKLHPERNLDLWCYTGYDFEDIKNVRAMQYIDVLVDGKFQEELKEMNSFRGSSNQNIIYLKNQGK